MGRALAAFMLICPLSHQANAQTKDAPTNAVTHKYRTKIDFSMEAANKDILLQCLYRELRKIPEILVVQDDTAHNDFLLSVVVIQDTSRSGYTLGYSSSLVVSYPLDPSVFAGIIDDKFKDIGTALLTGASYPAQHVVLTDNSLDSLCKRITAEFETGPLEETRQASQKYQPTSK